MSFDRDTLKASVDAHGTLIRVLVAGTKGSAPRDAGTSMLVWQNGQSGTIGGGALEFQASNSAREMLVSGTKTRQITQPLGTALGQCCGGSVTLVFERFCAQSLPPTDSIFLRPVGAGSTTIPALLQRRIDAARTGLSSPALTSGWLAESLIQNTTPIWIFGAGHVGDALARALAPLPEFSVTLIDTDQTRLPKTLPPNITVLTSADLAALVEHAPPSARHFIMTMDHAIDLEICHRLLAHRHGTIGLIGSKTKWARFQNRLGKLGHTPDEIQRITCPIGDPALGKEPHAIAIGITHALLLERTKIESTTDIFEGRGT